MVKIIAVAVFASSLALNCAAGELTESDFLGDFPIVLTASRLQQPAQDAPSSISVIDRAMIAASGFQNIAELFQLVPGYYVAQKSGHNFAVFSGVGDEYSRQLQVLVDGRSVYLPATGGMQWDALPLEMSDIDRIEVVHGPDADSYGANAMMGVINIITRRPAEEAGHTLALTGGSQNSSNVLFRWAGGEANKQRVTLSWRQNDGFINLNDSTQAPLFTYSGDFDVGPDRNLNLQLGYVGGTRGAGDLPHYADGLDLAHDIHVNSQYQQLDYRVALADGGEWLFKTYHNALMDQESIPYGPTGKPYYLLSSSYNSDIAAERWHIETQWNRPLNDVLRFSIGGYLRRDTAFSPLYFGTENDLTASSLGVFSHAEYRLARNWLLNAGAMWEDYDLVGPRVSPHVSLSWQPGPNHTLRMGVSRAYRDPLLFERYADYSVTVQTKYGPNTQKELTANAAIRPEVDLSREIGYLGNWPEIGLTLDLRLHMEKLQDMINFVHTSAGILQSGNQADSLQRGVDGQLRWRFAPHSFVLLNYAYLRIDSTPTSLPYFPPRVASLLLSHRFGRGIDVSLGYYQGDTMKMLSADKPPAYHRTNLGIAREFKQDGHPARLALILQDLGPQNYGYNVDTANDPVRDRLSRQAFVRYQIDY